MAFEIGDDIGPYQIIAQVGQGGMATVYKGYHTNLDRYVALKVMHSALSQDETFLGRFQREAQVVGGLDHENIVAIHDFASHHDHPYLVMRFIEGMTLKSLMRQQQLSSEQIEHLVQKVGSALSYAHKQGVLHRDIKPSNVIIDKEGKIFLTDFGLARMAQAAESTLSRDMLLGTPQYISPEQARGDTDVDARADMYSFAVVIFEMIVGRVPFTGDTPYSIVHDHIYTPLPKPSIVNPNVPIAVESFLEKALAKDRNDRYSSVSEMVRAYSDALNNVGHEAIDDASQAIPRTPEQVREITGEPDPVSEAGVRERIVRQETVRTIEKRRPNKLAWPMAGIVLLVLALIASGIILGRAISEEYQRTFIDDLGSWHLSIDEVDFL